MKIRCIISKLSLLFMTSCVYEPVNIEVQESAVNVFDLALARLESATDTYLFNVTYVPKCTSKNKLCFQQNDTSYYERGRCGEVLNNRVRVVKSIIYYGHDGSLVLSDKSAPSGLNYFCAHNDHLEDHAVHELIHVLLDSGWHEDNTIMQGYYPGRGEYITQSVLDKLCQELPCGNNKRAEKMTYGQALKENKLIQQFCKEEDVCFGLNQAAPVVAYHNWLVKKNLLVTDEPEESDWAGEIDSCRVILDGNHKPVKVLLDCDTEEDK